MPLAVAATQGDLQGLAGPAIDGQLPQSQFHAAREPDRELRQSTAKVLEVELAVKLL
jgi:hypothetical protein